MGVAEIWGSRVGLQDGLVFGSVTTSTKSQVV